MDPLTRARFRNWKRRVLRGYLILFSMLVVPLCARAADESLEYRVKAAFLLNFTKFVDWPATAFGAADAADRDLHSGRRPIRGSVLDQIVAGRSRGPAKSGRARESNARRPRSPARCYLSARRKRTSLKMLPGLGPGVLTVGEGESFVRDGGMIAFVLEERRVRFGVNQTAAESAGLRLSSKLLNVARSIEK